MSITIRSFGHTREGRPVTLLRMENAAGACAEVLDYGARLRSMVVPDRDGKPRDVCLGFDSVAEYEANGDYLGALVGRCANRIRGGRFRLGGREYALTVNQGANHLHGGARGFDRYVWEHRLEGESVVFSRTSPAGEEGYPGLLRVEAAYTLTEDNALCLRLTAEADEDTVVNLTGHAYWNLNGQGAGEVGEHTLSIDAIAFTELAEDGCPNGTIASVVGTPFDLREPRALREGWDTTHPQIRLGGGYDHNWILRGDGLREAAVLRAPESGISLHLSTTQPGLQVYTANGLSARQGKSGASYVPRGAVALEGQGFPNAVNEPTFPTVVLAAGEIYQQEIVFAFRHD